MRITISSGHIQDHGIFEKNLKYHIWNKQVSGVKNWIHSSITPSHLKLLIRKEYNNWVLDLFGEIFQWWFLILVTKNALEITIFKERLSFNGEMH